MKPLYQQIYHSLKEEIIKGKFTKGDRLPSEKELSTQYQVSRITSKKALEKLMNEGLVFRQRGRGTFVTEEALNKYAPKISSKKPLFGLIMTNMSASFGSKLISAFLQETDKEASFVLKVSLGRQEKEDQAVKELMELGVDGIVIAPANSEHFSPEILKLVINKFPLVLIDRSIKRYGISSVATNNRLAAKNGTNYLFELGHHDIAVLIPSHYKTTSLEDRVAGIIEAFAEHNIMIDKELWLDEIYGTPPSPLYSNEEDFRRIKQHIQNHPQVTAYYALEFHMALLAKRAIEELGMVVPNDISIICFDHPSLNDIDMEFTHIRQNEKEIARKSVQRLIELYNGNKEVYIDQIDATIREGVTTKVNNRDKSKYKKLRKR